MKDSKGKVYEVAKSYTVVELHHVRADSAEEAEEKMEKGYTNFCKSYDGEYDRDSRGRLILTMDGGPWELADYEAMHGEFEEK